MSGVAIFTFIFLSFLLGFIAGEIRGIYRERRRDELNIPPTAGGW